MKSIFYYIDKLIKICYLILFAFAPLIMSHLTSELFEFNKMLFIYLITLIVGCLWLIKMVIFKKIIIKKTKLDIVIFLFLLSQILSTIFSIDKLTSVFGYYGRFNGGLLSIFSYIVLYYGFVSNCKYNDIIRLLKISLFTSLIVIIWGLPGKLGYDLTCFLFTGQLNNYCWTDQFRPSERLFSTLGQPNWLGAYLVINFFLGVFFYLKSTTKKNNFFWVIYLFLNIMTILFTRSRSSFLALFIGLIIFLLNYLLNNQNKKRKVFIVILAFIINLLLFKTGINQVDKYLSFSFIFNNFKKNQVLKSKSTTQSSITFNNVTDSGTIRKIVWKGAIELGKRYPIFGTGVETFAYAYYFVRPKEHNLTSEWDYLYNKAHNEFLNYLATTGFVGLTTYLLMIFFVLFIGTRFLITKNKILSDKQNIAFFLVIAYLSILITNFFGFSTTTINLYFYLIPAFLIINNSNELKNKVYYQELQEPETKQKISVIFIFFIFIFGLNYLINYWRADYYYARAKEYAQLNNFQQATLLLNKALSLHYEHIYQDKLSYYLTNLALIAFSQNEKDTIKNLVNSAEYYNNQSLIASSKNILYLKTKSKINYTFYQMTDDKKYLEETVKALDQLVNLSPTDPNPYYTRAIIFSVLSENKQNNLNTKVNWQKKSINEINRAIELKSNFYDAYLLKGQLLAKFGRKKEAKKVFEFILDKINPQDQEVKKELKRLSID